MKNQNIQFEIIDHRKNKRVPLWATAFLMHINVYLKPMKMFNEIEYPTSESIYNATVSILAKLEKESKKRWLGIIPDVKFDRENNIIRIFNSTGNLLFEIIEQENELLAVIEKLQRKPKIFGYARVSTKKQSLKMQVDALKNFGCEQIEQEQISALSVRPVFKLLLNSLQKGDTLVVWKLDRMGRSMLDLIKLVSEMDAKGVYIIIEKGSSFYLKSIPFRKDFQRT